MDQEAQPGRFTGRRWPLPASMRAWLEGGEVVGGTPGELLAEVRDMPEVGRGGGRVLAGTTGELASCLQHIAGCPSCHARWPRAGYVAMELAGDHVAFTVDVGPAEPEPTRPEATPEVEPKASRSLPQEEGGIFLQGKATRIPQTVPSERVYIQLYDHQIELSGMDCFWNTLIDIAAGDTITVKVHKP